MTLRRDTEKARQWARRSRRKWRQHQSTRRPPTPQQLRRTDYEAEHRAMRAVVLVRDRYCRAHVEDRCTGWSTEAHHVLSRARGGPNELWNYLGFCASCHAYVHGHPLEAETQGWLASIGACCDLEARAA